MAVQVAALAFIVRGGDDRRQKLISRETWNMGPHLAGGGDWLIFRPPGGRRCACPPWVARRTAWDRRRRFARRRRCARRTCCTPAVQAAGRRDAGEGQFQGQPAAQFHHFPLGQPAEGAGDAAAAAGGAWSRASQLGEEFRRGVGERIGAEHGQGQLLDAVQPAPRGPA